MPKVRLDQLLHQRELCDSREQAKRLILAGEVRVEGVDVGVKPGLKVDDQIGITIKEKPRFVSRGGLKIEKALDHFQVDVTDKVVFDAGASTGGFTDCVLQRGARHVYAYDVGKNQLAWKIRQDPRVTCREGINLRHLVPDDVGETVDLVVMDLSFISLKKILGPIFSILQPAGDVLCLIKPQFELERDQIGRGGIVREPELRQQAVDNIHDFVVNELGKRWLGVTESPITGTDGNVEFLAWLQHPA